MEEPAGKLLEQRMTPGGVVDVPWRFGGVRARESGDGWERLAVGADEDRPGLVADLVQGWPDDLRVLWVLHVSRLGRETGRYESPHPLALAEVLGLLRRFRRFLDLDARHHLWIARAGSKDQVVLDMWGVVYVYGDLEAALGVLDRRGIREGALEYPWPAGHPYWPVLDEDERAMHGWWPWTRTPLRERDDR
jgi:hypothetical protein